MSQCLEMSVGSPWARPHLGSSPDSRSVRRTLLFVLAGIGAASMAAPRSAGAADPKIAVKAHVRPEVLAPHEVGCLCVDIDIPPGFHLWSLDPGPGPLPLTLALEPGAPLAFDGPWHGPLPQTRLDRGFKRELAFYEGERVHLERSVRLDVRDDRATERTATLIIHGQICTDETCIPQATRVEVTVRVAGETETAGALPPEPKGPVLAERSPATPSATAVPSGPEPASAASGDAVETSTSQALDAAKKEGVVAFMLLAFLFGFSALATPCVFPAIPLTVSFFSKYSKESFGRGARLALVYALTMVAAFTGLGVLISVIFGVTGIQRFAAHPAFNLVLALVLLFFSLNLLGMFEITTPDWLLVGVNRLEARYGRSTGLPSADGAKKTGGALDYAVVAVAAITATTVFFTCTVAFVGLVLVAAARGQWFWPTIGMLAFASAFALPFFLLALFPQAAARLRGKAGNWLTMTRVTLGFLELAAAMKFLSNADLVWSLNLLSRDVVLAIWIPLFALAGLYMLGKLHLGEGSASEGGRVSVVQVLASIAMFALSIHMAVGLFSGRPLGGWIDGWLPPRDYPVARGAGTKGAATEARAGAGESARGLVWMDDLAAARRRAHEKRTLVFANYTGYTCTNCRYMEGAVFPRPEIERLLETMTLVELYTDGGRPEHERNREDQAARFGTAALPLYAVERSDGTILGTFASSTNDANEFKTFLERAIERDRKETKRLEAANGPPPRGRRDPDRALAAADAEGEAPRGLILRTTRLADGRPEPAIVPGKWTLVNFWASWCAPCIEELEQFMVRIGRDLEAQGGHFATVAIEDDTGVALAKEKLKRLGLSPASALRLPADPSPEELDPSLEFSGALPYTILISPSGQVVWKHREKLTRKRLEGALACFVTTAPADAKALALLQEKCVSARP